MTAASRKAVRYAERELGVHLVHHEAHAARKCLEEDLADLNELRRHKRQLENELTDREMGVVEEQRTKHPDMSQAAMERRLKVLIWTDEQARKIRSDLEQVQYHIDLRESSIRLSEATIKIAASRLQELGGYLNYLAAIKQADEANQDTEAGEAK